ncbi:hypothetical protein HHK36_003719 [Tetracentron sinense]|uniref:WD repeat-containing protein 44 n=1 Tax=Tetracentron sinense TaxID=13715 RepID=A0A834ZPT3_TETSI|nr:hypothetical protein HHK36_003719 [Tetracentron sinense]
MNTAGEEDDDDERFYESLDRILSSSSSTSSAAASEDEDLNSPNYASENLPISRFPMALSKYDVWISEPSSIQERRNRLLREMGLIGDRSLSRLKSNLAASDNDEHRDGELGRSVSSDGLNSQEQEEGNSGVFLRSKSDSAADCNSSLSRSPLDHCNSSISSPSVHSIDLIQSVPEIDSSVNNHLVVKPRSNGSPTANVVSPNKPPTGKPSRRAEEIRSDLTNVNPNPNPNSNGLPVLADGNGGELDDDLDCNGIVEVPDQVCTIKNLDNGKEFVVNEVREDGMWDKLREVGTGRQLTMEEFEMFVGHSPIVQELMRRQNVEELNGKKDGLDSNGNVSGGNGSKSKKKGSWFKSIRNVASTMTGNREKRSSDDRDTSSEKGGRRSSSATDDSQDVSFHGPERVRVRQYGKSYKELTSLYKSQEIQAHNGSIWSIKFSLDGSYLASAGEDCVIHVWQVVESEKKGELLMEKPEDGNLSPFFGANGSPEPTSVSPNVDNYSEKKRRGKVSLNRKSVNLDHFVVPETIFALSEKPICSFLGHLADVLDLSWSKSQSTSRYINGLKFQIQDEVALHHLVDEAYQLALKVEKKLKWNNSCKGAEFRGPSARVEVMLQLLMEIEREKAPTQFDSKFQHFCPYFRARKFDNVSAYCDAEGDEYVEEYEGDFNREHLLSSSMDKTVRLWHMSSKSCLKIFSHSDYVTCIQFNPIDDKYFISGSLDAKVRIWSIPDRQVVDWNDLHEMVTAACYTPDGQGALVGSYKGSCRLYNTSENKLHQKSQINLQNKKKSHLKKITGFQALHSSHLLIHSIEQFAPGSSSEVLITSADSRIRVIEGVDLVHKFKGFRNTTSQISASLTENGKYVVCASEDSHVYVWKHEGDFRSSRSKGVTVTRSYEHFHCQDVSVAIPWPGIGGTWEMQDSCIGEQTELGNQQNEVFTANHPPTPVEETIEHERSPSASWCTNSPLHGIISSANNSYFLDRISATWPEEKLVVATKNRSPRGSVDFSNGIMQGRSAWGMVIVTAGLGGEIKVFQNFGLPVRI